MPLRTRGQPYAAAAVRGIVATGLHAVLLVGPPSVGKTTLALDLAATLLCIAADPVDRPCGACRGCRLVASGNHPDLHRLRPEGPGGQVRIEQVRGLASELALLSVEGGARIAVVEEAHRLNEDAQNALLKTLEEPPGGVTIVLCADDEDALLPTVRSRCARVRLGPVGAREVEALLGELGLADAPRAARLARLSSGRPGLAIAYATADDAALARTEVARTLLDLASAGPTRRLVAIRELQLRSMMAASALAPLEAGDAATGGRPARGAKGRRGSTPSGDASAAVREERPSTEDRSGPAEDGDVAASKRASAAERRRAASWLIDAWRDVARDLAVLDAGQPRAVRDIDSLDELQALAARLPPGAAASFLRRLERAGERLASNASPELLIDALVLAWPHAA
ncbi:MAG TPA: AAA family ATPase [Candidatus Dormibacteraeota bacterium]|nr:AAA family ATPase [Candidatus Dormibacteraeota bacterium]